MTSRRRWLRQPVATQGSACGLEYECLEEDSPRIQKFPFVKQPRRTVIVVAATPEQQRATTIPIKKSRASLVRNSDRRRPVAVRGGSGAALGKVPRNDFSSSSHASVCDIDDVTTPFCWPSFGAAADERPLSKEADDDDEDEEINETEMYMLKYYTKSIYSKSSIQTECQKLLDHNLRSKEKRLQLNNDLGLSQSFETQETQLEEASETSLCTTDDDDDDPRGTGRNSERSIDGKPTDLGTDTKGKKRIKWLDENPGCALITKVHSLDYASEPSYTCRVVFLLLMDRGPQSAASNFEFLHCEFRHEDRVRVCDALPQITRLVLGTSDAPLNTTNGVTRTEEPFRPFTRLYLDGRELINTLALQDYCLEDGQSTLVAIRESLSSSVSKGSNTPPNDKERRVALLKQSELLLADKRLRRGIRKARIAGRSLQILYGTQGMIEQEQLSTRQQESGNNNDVKLEEETDDVDGNDVNILPENCDAPWSVFDNLARTSFDNDELSDANFDVDFFDGTHFFCKPTTGTRLQSPSTEQHQAFGALEFSDSYRFGWASFDLDFDIDKEEGANQKDQVL
jgi:hypothetical protein